MTDDITIDTRQKICGVVSLISHCTVDEKERGKGTTRTHLIRPHIWIKHKKWHYQEP
jgi:hypothetical protein